MDGQLHLVPSGKDHIGMSISLFVVKSVQYFNVVPLEQGLNVS